MSEQINRIFLTRENLAFSMPLILTCVIYSYFKFIPLQIGIPILVFAFIAYQIRVQFEKQRAKKLTNLDEKTIQDLIGEITKDDKVEDAVVRKAKNKVKQRLAQERKMAETKAKTKKSNERGDDDELDEDDLLTFAKKK